MGLLSGYSVSQNADLGPLPPPPGFRWIWANAAERYATVVSSVDVGAGGFQTDIGLEFELLVSEPMFWGVVPAADIISRRLIIPGVGGWLDEGWNHIGTSGPIPPLDITSRLASIYRGPIQTEAFSPGNLIFMKENTLAPGHPTLAGIRYTFFFGLESAGPTWRWFVGLQKSPPADNINKDPLAIVDGVGVGCSGDTVIRVIHNDGVGAVASNIALSTSDFPGATNGSIYRLDIYVPRGGLSWRYNLRNILANKETSGTLTVDIPDPTVLLYWTLWVTSGTVTAGRRLAVIGVFGSHMPL